MKTIEISGGNVTRPSLNYHRANINPRRKAVNKMEKFWVVTVKGTLIDTEVHPFKDHDGAVDFVKKDMVDKGTSFDLCTEQCYDCWSSGCTTHQDVEWEIHATHFED